MAYSFSVKMKAALVAFFLVVGVVAPFAPTPVSAATATLFSDDFAAGFTDWTSQGSRWETSGGVATLDLNCEVQYFLFIPIGVDCESNVSGADGELTKAVSTEGYENITVAFSYKINKPLEASDAFIAEWCDGETCTELLNLTNQNVTEWTSVSVSLPAQAADNADFSVRFRGNDFVVSDDLGVSTPYGDEVQIDTVTVSGEEVVIVEPEATLIIRKVLVGEGPLQVDDFSFEVNEAEAVAFEEDGENQITVSPGTYSIVESAAAEYVATYNNSISEEATTCDNLVLADGETVTCTITNTYSPAPTHGTLIVNKVVINNESGTATTSDFILSVFDGEATTTVNSGMGNEFLPGTVTVREINLEGYTGVFSGDCSATGEVVIEAGIEYVCTITNTFVEEEEENPQEVPSTPTPTTGGGGGAGIIPNLIIHTEKITRGAGLSVVVTWMTNKPATSRVVYGTGSRPAPAGAPNYGYEFSTGTTDESPKVLFHSVTISGLQKGLKYFFRPISAASPEIYGSEIEISISEDEEIVVPPAEETPVTPEPSTPTTPVTGDDGTVAGVSTGDEEQPAPEGQVAGVKFDERIAQNSTTTPVVTTTDDTAAPFDCSLYMWIVFILNLLGAALLGYLARSDDRAWVKYSWVAVAILAIIPAVGWPEACWVLIWELVVLVATAIAAGTYWQTNKK